MGRPWESGRVQRVGRKEKDCKMNTYSSRWVMLVVVFVFVQLSLGGSVAGQGPDQEDQERLWAELRAGLEGLRGNSLLGLDDIQYSRYTTVRANAARDSRQYDWSFLRGDGQDLVREYLFVEDGRVERKPLFGEVQVRQEREQKGSGIFNFLVKDVWWTRYTETIGDGYVIRRDRAGRYGHFDPDESGNRPSTHFLSHATQVIQASVTDECKRRFADRRLLTGLLEEALSDDAEDLAFYRAVFDRIEWPLPLDVCDPDKGPKLMTIFRNAFGEEVEQATSQIYKPPPPSVR